MTNPAAAMRMLVTYAVCMPLAMVVGYLITNPMDYGTVGFLGVVIALIISPVFIKWHYPIMVFGLGCPMYIFLLKGDPPLWQVVAILSFGIAIVERALSAERRFLRVPALTWPLIFLTAVVLLTSQLTGGIGLNTLGGAVAGGKKYLVCFLGIAVYFALTSRAIPKQHRNLYVALYFLSATPAFISDLFPLLPYPLNYINLLFPPSSTSEEFNFGITRLGAFATTASAISSFMLAKFGLRGIFEMAKPWRFLFFSFCMTLALLGGYRTTVITFAIVIGILFFVEGLHRTKLLLVFLLGGMVLGGLLVPFSNKLPFTFQRALCFIPLKWDADAEMSAEGSAEWRYKMWHDLWPQVPQYLLLGKGYAFSQLEFQEYMGANSMFANSAAAQLDASQQALALSGDYHSGPLSTLIPFGVWGAAGMVWLMAACLWVQYRIFKHGDPALKLVNSVMFVWCIQHVIFYFFIFGSFSDDIFGFAKAVGFSIALNGGVPSPKPKLKPEPVAVVRPLGQPRPQLA